MPGVSLGLIRHTVRVGLTRSRLWPEGALCLGPDKYIALDGVGQHDVTIFGRLAEGEYWGGGHDILVERCQWRVPCINH